MAALFLQYSVWIVYTEHTFSDCMQYLTSIAQNATFGKMCSTFTLVNYSKTLIDELRVVIFTLLFIDIV